MKLLRSTTLAALLATGFHPAFAADKPHNVLIFVADGLRYVSVTPKSAPTLWRIKSQGVDFTNSHSLYPTITTVNASAIATGHYIGDTGNFGNAIFSGFGNPPVIGFEDDKALGEMNDHFGGNYLNEKSLIAGAREAGFATAVMGKVGPTAIQDVTERDGKGTIVIDDAFNTDAGITVAPKILDAIKAAGLDSTAPKMDAPNNKQQQYMISVATKVVLPKLAASGKPFAMLYWSRDPDMSQHVQKDNSINGPTGQAGIKDADDTLAALLAWLKANKLDTTTDVFVTADHGFSTIDNLDASGTARHSKFLATDLGKALNLPVTKGAALGTDPAHPDVLVVPNGGSDLIYLFGADTKAHAAQVVDSLTKLDYVSGVFVNDDLGDVPGALPMSAINWRGTALTPHPAIVVSFASHLMKGCKPELMCAAETADTSLATGQGMHGTFSRADTRNFMAAIGPDFKARFADKAPVSNADINPTLAGVMGLHIQPKGGLVGRSAAEALKGGKSTSFSHSTMASAPAANGQKTVLEYQRVGDTRYFDAAGFPGRTVGLTAH
ncbi:MAG TPA: alkaline phosphatase family protein [Rhizomicrobium sp.]|nr:alkaline phosphatase family protein [Rhizomicrobium sp.]